MLEQISEKLEQMKDPEHFLGEAVLEEIDGDDPEEIGAAILAVLQNCEDEDQADRANEMLVAITGKSISEYFDQYFSLEN